MSKKQEQKRRYNKKHRDLQSAWDTIAQYVNDKETFADLLMSESVKRRFGSDHINVVPPQLADLKTYADQSKMFFSKLKSDRARTAYKALAFRKLQQISLDIAWTALLVIYITYYYYVIDLTAASSIPFAVEVTGSNAKYIWNLRRTGVDDPHMNVFFGMSFPVGVTHDVCILYMSLSLSSFKDIYISSI